MGKQDMSVGKNMRKKKERYMCNWDCREIVLMSLKLLFYCLSYTYTHTYAHTELMQLCLFTKCIFSIFLKLVYAFIVLFKHIEFGVYSMVD